MIDVKVSDIAAWCGGELSGDGDKIISSVTKDSRNVPEGSLYIALKGERFDGNDFLKQVFDSGAAAAVGEVDFETAGSYIKVRDSKQALLDIAASYRKLFYIPSVAITGSVGKTTTKEMIASVLSQSYNCLKTEGNYNNEIGMPLTVLGLSREHEIAVFEMGMSHFGEISKMTAVARPDMAVISNIGMSHIGNLGSQENILKAKLEITEGLKQGGVLAVNGDDKLLGRLSDCVKFGTGDGCDIKAENISETDRGSCFDVSMNGKMYNVTVNIPGIHNVYNALAAIAVGLNFDVEPKKIVAGIAKACSVGNRMKISETDGGIRLISDCYNASPDSMRAAIEVLKKEKGRKVAVLADMLEMGEFSVDAHREIGRLTDGLDAVIAIGDAAKYIAESAGLYCWVRHFENNKTASEFLKGFLTRGDSVLVKGSNGMKLGEICDFIEVNFK